MFVAPQINLLFVSFSQTIFSPLLLVLTHDETQTGPPQPRSESADSLSETGHSSEGAV